MKTGTHGRKQNTAKTPPSNAVVDPGKKSAWWQPSTGERTTKGRQNQLFLDPFSVAGPVDLWRLTRTVEDHLAGKADDRSERLREAFVLLAELSSGRRWDKWAGLQVTSFGLQDTDPIGEIPPGLVLRYEQGTGKGRELVGGFWWLRPFKPARGVSDKSGQLIEDTDGFVAVAVPDLMLRVLEALLARKPGKKLLLQEIGKKPEGKRKIKAAEAFWYNRRYSNATIVSYNWLYRQLANAAGSDPALAAVATARNERLGQSASYYGVIRRSRTLSLSAKALRSADLEAKDVNETSFGKLYTQADLDAPLGEAGVGTWGAGHVVALRDALNSAREKGEIDGLHKAMTNYTVALFAMASGHRATSRNSLAYPWVCNETGFAQIQDKGIRTARLIWVPTVLRDQLGFFEEHIKSLRMKGVNITHQGALPIGNLHRNRLYPKAISKYYKEVFGTYKAFNRHYLRDSLLPHVGRDVLSAFLGHTLIGTEPWSSESGLDPYAYRRVLEEHLTQLLDDDGWTACPGLV